MSVHIPYRVVRIWYLAWAYRFVCFKAFFRDTTRY